MSLSLRLTDFARPIPIKTASKPCFIIVSRLKPAFNSFPRRKIILSLGTSANIAAISLFSESPCLSDGITDSIIPPNSLLLSNIVTVCPASSNFAAQARPAGPAPIIAMFFPLAFLGIRNFDQPFLSACSARYLCISAIGRGASPIKACRQLPSHCCSTGQSQAQISGNILFSLSTSYASFSLPSRNNLMNFGISTPAGQPSWHVGS